MTKPPRRGPASALRSFLRSEAAGGVLLMVAAALAMLVANSPLGEAYQHLLHAVTGPTLAAELGPMTVHLWINDGLMAVFFLLVGLEIKRAEEAERRPALVESARRALELKRANRVRHHPGAGRTASHGMRSLPNRGDTARVDPREVGRVSQAVRAAQVRRDR